MKPARSLWFWKSQQLGMVATRLFLLAALFFPGCGRGRHKKSAVDVNLPPQRIVCGTPALAEIVYCLGCGDRVVGVSDMSAYPPEAAKKETIGAWLSPNRERLLVIKPDFIVSQINHEALEAFAREYNIRFLGIKLSSLADICCGIEMVATQLGVSERGTEVVREINKALEEIRARSRGKEPRRVLLLFGRSQGSLSGLMTVGPGTFLDDLLQVAGGTNIFSDVAGPYPQISKESVLVRKPEVIIELHPEGLSEKTMILMRADWQQFAELPAVQANRISYLTNDFLLIPGPRVGGIARVFHNAIWPELSEK